MILLLILPHAGINIFTLVWVEACGQIWKLRNKERPCFTLAVAGIGQILLEAEELVKRLLGGDIFGYDSFLS